MKLQYTFTRQFFLRGLRPEPPLGAHLPPAGGIAPPDPEEGVPPLYTSPCGTPYSSLVDFAHSEDYLNNLLGNPHALPSHKRSMYTPFLLTKGVCASKSG
jgi:hypothetical protein